MQKMKKCWQGKKRIMGLEAEVCSRDMGVGIKKDLEGSRFFPLLGGVGPCLSGTQACD